MCTHYFYNYNNVKKCMFTCSYLCITEDSVWLILYNLHIGL